MRLLHAKEEVGGGAAGGAGEELQSFPLPMQYAFCWHCVLDSQPPLLISITTEQSSEVQSTPFGFGLSSAVFLAVPRVVSAAEVIQCIILVTSCVQ
jgi:hypothetical protein